MCYIAKKRDKCENTLHMTFVWVFLFWSEKEFEITVAATVARKRQSVPNKIMTIDFRFSLPVQNAHISFFFVVVTFLNWFMCHNRCTRRRNSRAFGVPKAEIERKKKMFTYDDFYCNSQKSTLNCDNITSVFLVWKNRLAGHRHIITYRRRHNKNTIEFLLELYSFVFSPFI